jgi:hypothetical protein
MPKLLHHKIQRLTYLIICLWVLMGCIGIGYDVEFAELAVYFASLSGFAAAYVFGELKRPSTTSALFMKGKSSSRERMMYWVVAIWFFLGCVGIVQTLSLTQMGAYFGALTPFVAAFIIGATFKPEVPVLSQESTPAEDKPEGEGEGDVDKPVVPDGEG